MSRNITIDEEAVRASLEAILKEIDETTDPEALNVWRRLFRKHVPLFRRAYVAAWLLKNQRGAGVSEGQRERRSPTPREGMTSIFIGIGKSRKVFPRDIMGMLLDHGGLSKEQIGSIKILDNYSFVEVENEACQGLIDKINNMEFRGRNIAVNFAKKKD